MKKILLATIGISFPFYAFAAPLSPWVSEVILTIDRGRSQAESIADPAECTSAMKTNLSEQNRNMLTETLSADEVGALERDVLLHKTLCLDNDRMLLEDAIQRILSDLKTETDACNQNAASLLRTVYQFAVDSYNDFLKGAMDPDFRSALLTVRHPFESLAAWQDNTGEAEQRTDTPICPFSSDFFEPSIAQIGVENSSDTELYRLGCDEDVLPLVSPPLREEAVERASFFARVRLFAEMVVSTVRSALADLNPSEENEDEGNKPPLSHETLEGCFFQETEEREDDLSKKEDLIRLRFPDIRSFTGATKQPGLVALVRVPRYSPFSLTPDTPSLILLFNDALGDYGSTRSAPSELTESLDDELQFTALITGNRLDDLKSMHANIHQNSGILDIIGKAGIEQWQDGDRAFNDALTRMRQVTQDTLPKKYLPDLFYFMTRSCLDGACQKTLESVLKRTLNPYCYPYTSGRYKEDDVPQKCYCEGQYASEEYCKGEVDTSRQPEVDLSCGGRE